MRYTQRMMTLYSLRDYVGMCRYVGVTRTARLRQQAHKAKLPHLDFVPLMVGLTKREASELEIALIKKLNENGPQLLNIRA